MVQTERVSCVQNISWNETPYYADSDDRERRELSSVSLVKPSAGHDTLVEFTYLW